MQHPSVGGRNADYHVTGNVIWLTSPAKARQLPRTDPIAALKRNVTRLAGQVVRSARANADIAAAIDARRYELYGRSATRSPERDLAAAQRGHLGSLLRFVHALAPPDPGVPGSGTATAVRLHPLAQSIRELEASLKRARRLSQDMLTQCQGRGRMHGL